MPHSVAHTGLQLFLALKYRDNGCVHMYTPYSYTQTRTHTPPAPRKRTTLQSSKSKLMM